MDVTGLSVEVLKRKAHELWEQIVRLETEKYDLEERQKRQDYDVRLLNFVPIWNFNTIWFEFQLIELKERQKMQLRSKAKKRGLDPE